MVQLGGLSFRRAAHGAWVACDTNGKCRVEGRKYGAGWVVRVNGSARESPAHAFTTLDAAVRDALPLIWEALGYREVP